jgi:hypothetical protein
MNIQSIELSEEGTMQVTLVDGSAMSVPNDMNNRHRVMVQKWIDAGNTPTPFVGPTDMELWKEKMAVSDGPLPRWAEDLVDGTISSQTQKLADDKKALRATRP